MIKKTSFIFTHSVDVLIAEVMDTSNDIDSSQKKSVSTDASTKLKGLCNVCGDKAFYNFYGSLACDSCRTFFRRQVLQKKELFCENDSSCNVTLKTRKQCSKCRLNKCYAVGMRVELVAPNEDQRIRRGRSTNVDRLTSRTQEIHGNSEAHVLSHASTDWSSNQCPAPVWSPTTTPSCSIDRTGVQTERNLVDYAEQESKQIACTSPKSGNDSTSLSILHSVLNPRETVTANFLHPSKTLILSLGHDLDKIVSIPIASKIQLPKFRKFAQRLMMSSTTNGHDGELYQVVPCSSLLEASPLKMSEPISEIRDGRYLNSSSEAENVTSSAASSILSTDPVDAVSHSLSALCISDSMMLQGMAMSTLMDEILIASKILTGRYYEIASSRNNEVVCATKLLYFGIQRVLKSCQSFSYFRELKLEDQEVLIKGSCTEMLLIRSLYHVNVELDAWIFYSPSGFQVKRTTRLYIKTLEKIQKNTNLYKAYHDLIRGVDQKLRCDNQLLTIMMALILFSPDRYNLPKDHKFKYIHKLYTRLLKNYLDERMDEKQSKAVLWKLVRLLTRLRLVREDYEKGTLNLTHADLQGLTETFYELSI